MRLRGLYTAKSKKSCRRGKGTLAWGGTGLERARQPALEPPPHSLRASSLRRGGVAGQGQVALARSWMGMAAGRDAAWWCAQVRVRGLPEAHR